MDDHTEQELPSSDPEEIFARDVDRPAPLKCDPLNVAPDKCWGATVVLA
jgi:hypothetical protein